MNYFLKLNIPGSFRRPAYSAQQICCLLTAAMAVAFSVGEAATVAISTGPNGAFSVSGTDLGQTLGTTLAMTSGSPLFSSALSKLNDGGIYGGQPAVGTPESLTPSNGSVVTYNLNLAVNTLGYDLSSIAVLTGSSQGRAAQAYTAAYATVSSPATFVTLAVLTGGEANNVALGNTEVQSILTNLNANNVASLRFTFQNVGGAESMYREIDVFGVASAPEPSRFVLLLGSLPLLMRRRRK